MAVGTESTAALMPTLASAVNASHAYGSGVLVSQSFTGQAAVCRQVLASVVGNKGTLCSWFVPQITAAHTSARATIRFSRLTSPGSNVAGTISLKIGSTVLGAINVDATRTLDSPSVVSLDITIPFDGSEYQRIDLVVDWPDHVSGGSNDETFFLIRSVHIYSKQLTSPLPAGAVASSGGQLVPIGQKASSTGAPFSAALGMALLNDLSAIDKRRKPILAWGTVRFISILDAVLLTTHKTTPTIRPQDLSLFGTHVVRNCPRGLRLRVVAELEATGEATSTAVFVAGPAGEAFGRAGRFDQSSVSTLALTVGNSQTVVVSGYLTVTTPSRMSMCADAHISVGVISHKEAVSTMGITSPAANIKSLAIWEDPQ